MQVADVDDDEADEDLERDAGNEESEHEVVEAVSVSPDVQQELQFCDLSEGEDRDERALCLRLRLLQLAVSRQQLGRDRRTSG